MKNTDMNFTTGQRVWATYHHTWNVNKPMRARVVFKAGRLPHLFSFDGDGTCDWYWILCEGNLLPSLFPETCLEDLQEYVSYMKRRLEENKDKIGQPGYSMDSYMKLKSTTYDI